VKPSQSVA
jgi:hypothetical protein